MELFIFIPIALWISYIDWKEHIIPDSVVLPSILALGEWQLITGVSLLPMLGAALFVVAIFLVPLFLNLTFGGGDLRFGVLCAILTGFPNAALFILIAALFHLIFLLALRKKSFGFAPAMSLAAAITYLFDTQLWHLIQGVPHV